MDGQIMVHFNAILHIMAEHGLSHAGQYMHILGIINNWWIDSSIHVLNAVGLFMGSWPF